MDLQFLLLTWKKFDMKNLFIIRGIPGSGKSTLADALNVQLRVAADDYFMEDGEYKWDSGKIGLAHSWCKGVVRIAMQNSVSDIAVHNTFTTEKEMLPYIEMAREFGFKVTTLIVENRHGNSSIHDVPEDTIEKMKMRFDVKL